MRTGKDVIHMRLHIFSVFISSLFFVLHGCGGNCEDGLHNADETDVDCGDICGRCAIDKDCKQDSDCETNVCEEGTCVHARSCMDHLIGLYMPGERQAEDGVYSIDPDGPDTSDEMTEPVYEVYCDMTSDGGGWALLLKSNGDLTFGYESPMWVNTEVVNEAEPSLAPGDNAKYQSFNDMPISELRGCFDMSEGDCIQMSFEEPAPALEFFTTLEGHLLKGYGGQFAPQWSTEPQCQRFGINAGYCDYRVRFGFTANSANNCESNGTAVGFGIGLTRESCPESTRAELQMGAGTLCASDDCSLGLQMPTPYGAQLWGRDTSMCKDGVENGFESGVDCGGPHCPPCKPGQECHVPDDCESGACEPEEDSMAEPAPKLCTVHARSCARIKTVDPAAPSGIYFIDPDGPDKEEGFAVYCDMETDGGGWILVASNYFNDGTMPLGLARTDLTIESGHGAAASVEADYLLGNGLKMIEFREARIRAELYEGDDTTVLDFKWPQSCYLCNRAEVEVEPLPSTSTVPAATHCHVDGQYLASTVEDPEIEDWVTDPSEVTVGGLCLNDTDVVHGRGADEAKWPGEGIGRQDYHVYTTWIR